MSDHFDREIFEGYLSRGLCSGKGAEDGQVCIETAIALACGAGFTDYPITCAMPPAITFGVRVNDAGWSSPEARASGMREFGLAQLGTQDLDQAEFSQRLVLETIRKILPLALRAVGLESHALACETAPDLPSARAVAAEAAAMAAGWAAMAAGWAAEAAAWAEVAMAAACSASAAAEEAAAETMAMVASKAARAVAAAAAGTADGALRTAAKIATEILNDMKNRR